VLFLLAAAVALTVNFPHMPDQRARIAAHADNVLNVSGMVFTGGLTGTGMVEHMARGGVGTIPDGMGPHMGLVTGILSLGRSRTSCRTTGSKWREGLAPGPGNATPVVRAGTGIR
jgi:Mg2+/citrate symporter